jgi:hypothetical protein
MNDPPNKIYLQFYGTEDGNDCINDDITWCVEQINNNDIIYIRGPCLIHGELGPLPAEQCLWGAENVSGYTAEQMEAERQRCYTLGVANATRKAEQ